MKGYMYILKCADGSYYTGSTKDIDLRLKQHQAGQGANHTRKRLPVELVYLEEFDRIDDAFYREKQVQGWSRVKKEALIKREYDRLHELAKCKNSSAFDSAQAAGDDVAQAAGDGVLPSTTLRQRRQRETASLRQQANAAVVERSRNHNVPKLRFSEFGNDWNIKKIADLGRFSGGGTPESSKKEYWQGNIPWISSSDVNDDSIHQIKKTRFITLNAIKDSATKIVPKGSVLMVSRVGIGKFAVANEDICTSQDFTNLVTDEESYFLAYYFKARASRFVKLSQGTSIKGFTGKDIKNAKFAIPYLPEQQKIAQFLTSVDTKIEKLTKKKNLIEQYKKGVMQQIFPSTGSGQLPQLRFKPDGVFDSAAFDSAAFESAAFESAQAPGAPVVERSRNYPDWEEKKLGEILDYEQPTKYLVESTEYDNSYKTPVLTAGKTFILGNTDETNSIYNNLPAIIFDDFTTANQFVNFPFKAKSSAMKILVAKESENIKFVFEAMQNIKYEIGGHRRHWISLFSKMKIPYPCKKEQAQIASFLSAIDNKIELVDNQLEKTREFKKGLLQQMFV